MLAGNPEAFIRRYWRGESNAEAFLDIALSPLELVYSTVASVREALYRSGYLLQALGPIPVISVGNLTVGGSGKTPVTALIAARVTEWGRRPAIVLRGYGDDEIRVHRELNPEVGVYAATRRIEAVTAAAREGADCAVVDDGFQHQNLYRNLNLVLIAAEQWEGRRHLLPRGPWREPLSALARADFCIVTRKISSAEIAKEIAAEVAGMCRSGESAVIHLAPTRLVNLGTGAEVRELDWLLGKDIVALASVAEPELFSRQLQQAGASVELCAFPDHHEFTAAELADVWSRAGSRPIIMTRKEAVKVRGKVDAAHGYVLEQEALLESGEKPLFGAIARAIGHS